MVPPPQKVTICVKTLSGKGETVSLKNVEKEVGVDMTWHEAFVKVFGVRLSEPGKWVVRKNDAGSTKHPLSAKIRDFLIEFKKHMKVYKVLLVEGVPGGTSPPKTGPGRGNKNQVAKKRPSSASAAAASMQRAVEGAIVNGGPPPPKKGRPSTVPPAGGRGASPSKSGPSAANNASRKAANKKLKVKIPAATRRSQEDGDVKREPNSTPATPTASGSSTRGNRPSSASPSRSRGPAGSAGKNKNTPQQQKDKTKNPGQNKTGTGNAGNINNRASTSNSAAARASTSTSAQQNGPRGAVRFPEDEMNVGGERRETDFDDDACSQITTSSELSQMEVLREQGIACDEDLKPKWIQNSLNRVTNPQLQLLKAKMTEIRNDHKQWGKFVFHHSLLATILRDLLDF